MISAVDAVFSMACNILQFDPGFVLSVLPMMYACLYGSDATFRRIYQNNYDGS